MSYLSFCMTRSLFFPILWKILLWTKLSWKQNNGINHIEYMLRKLRYRQYSSKTLEENSSHHSKCWLPFQYGSLLQASRYKVELRAMGGHVSKLGQPFSLSWKFPAGSEMVSSKDSWNIFVRHEEPGLYVKLQLRRFIAHAYKLMVSSNLALDKKLTEFKGVGGLGSIVGT